MPLTDSLHTSDGITIYLWNPTETVQELLQQLDNTSFLSGSEAPDIHRLPAKRACEILTIRVLIQQIFGDSSLLAYHPNGAPYLQHFNGHISISHTRSCVALGIHPSQKIGIDVENKTEKICRIQKKFINTDEAEQLSPQDPVTGITFLWSAKESLYKALQSTGVDFRAHLHVTPINPAVTAASVPAYQTRTTPLVHYKIHYRLYPDFILTAAIAETPPGIGISR